MKKSPSNFLALLHNLRDDGVSVWPDADSEKLHIWPSGRLTAGQLAFIRKHKTQIIAYLRHRNSKLLPSNEVCDEWRRRYCNTTRQRTT